jgi:glc operon protein GlcG
MASLRAVDCRDFIKIVVDKATEMQVPISVALVNEAGHINRADG